MFFLFFIRPLEYLIYPSGEISLIFINLKLKEKGKNNLNPLKLST
jgi:hypothetical protein